MSKTQDPRIAPKEMIVTRFKSAQQRRQLRDKDVQVEPKPPRKGSRKPAKSPRKKAKSPVVEDADERKEFYPEKLKRIPGERRVFLKPKPNMKTVARTNKRKFNTPQKGMKPLAKHTWPQEYDSHSIGCQSPVYSELSMEEVIRIVEDTGSLDDEDLMEILTCPSPVWWEKPAGEMYIEEAICSRNPEDSTLSPIKERCLQTYTEQIQSCRRKPRLSIDTDCIKDMTNDSEFKLTEIKDERFIKKRKKLENLLGNIKNKALCNNETAKTEFKEDKIETQCKNESTVENTKRRLSSDHTNIESGNNPNDKVIDKSLIKQEPTDRKVKRLSESTEVDMADLTADDDMLQDLENMDIPVEDIQPRASSSDSIIFINDDGNRITIIDDDSKITCNDKIDNKACSLAVKHELIDVYNEANKINTDGDKITEEMVDEKPNVDDKSTIKLLEVPKNLPPLKKRPNNRVFTSPISFKNTTDDPTESSSVSSHDISDTISDTNIKFIMDDDETSDTDSKQVKEEKSDHVNLNEDVKTKDYITVYKIVPNNEMNVKCKNLSEYSKHVDNLKQLEVKSDCVEESKGLNTFFKKCKNVNRKRHKRTDVKISDSSLCDSCGPKKSITVAQDENVKYCLNCSSIFDTDECSYCLKSETVCVHDPDKSRIADSCTESKT